MITAFSCQERNILSNVVWEQENTPSSASRYHSLLCIYHVVFLYIQFCTWISTSSKTMQPISLTPAPTRTFAEIETLGPICSKKQLRKFTRKSGEGKRGAGGGVGEMWKDRKFKVVKDRKFLGCSLVKEVLIFSIGGADTRYKPPITHTYRRKSKKKTAQPVALWMEHTSYWAWN